MASGSGLQVYVNSRVFISILLLILTITALHAAEPKNIIVFLPSAWEIETEDSIIKDIHTAIVDVVDREAVLETEEIALQLDSEQIGGVIDYVHGNGDAPRLELPPDQLDLIQNAAVIIIPEVTLFEMSGGAEAPFVCRMGVFFNVLETGRGRILDTFSLETKAAEATEEESRKQAVAGLQRVLEREVRRRGYFTDESPIIEILDTRHLVLFFGKMEHVEPGDEFLLLPPRGSAGLPGLMFIEEVSGAVSYGYVIYSPEKVSRETGVEKIERLGIDVSVYGRPMISLEDGDIPFSTAFGVRGFPVRRFPHVRPFLGVEFPLHRSIGEWPGLPVNGIFGLETCWNLGRFQIAPASGLGVGVLVPTGAGDELMVSHLGYSIEAVFSFLVHPDIRLFLSVGYSEWSCISKALLSASGTYDYGGILLGTGIRIKL